MWHTLGGFLLGSAPGMGAGGTIITLAVCPTTEHQHLPERSFCTCLVLGFFVRKLVLLSHHQFYVSALVLCPEPRFYFRSPSFTAKATVLRRVPILRQEPHFTSGVLVFQFYLQSPGFPCGVLILHLESQFLWLPSRAHSSHLALVASRAYASRPVGLYIFVWAFFFLRLIFT